MRILQGSGVIPGQPVLGIPGDLGGMLLKGDEVVERVYV